jgi:hypothetical protein
MLSLPERTNYLSLQIEKENAKSDKETFVCTVPAEYVARIKDVRF